VVVIGGGDTGNRCVGTAIRQGANSVVQLEILPARRRREPPDNPWPQWPKVYKMDYGRKRPPPCGAPTRAAISSTRAAVGEAPAAADDRHG